MVKKSPIVVAALQSPFLLNRWARTREWNLFYEQLGDHDGLAESKYLELSKFSNSGINDASVDAVLVTSPLQLETARRRFPGAWVFWVVHTGFFLEVFPSEYISQVDGIITLSQRVQDIQYVHKPVLHTMHNFVITPWYEANPVWKWKRNTLWTIRSRPQSRMEPERIPFEYTIKRIHRAQIKSPSLSFKFYGQNAPDGYITARGKARLFKNSSAYIGALPIDAGFGLAEHEALAAGVPIVCMRWGDFPREMSADYAALVQDMKDLPKEALRLAVDKEYAENISQLGIKYIETYRTQASMDLQIRAFSRIVSRPKNPRRTFIRRLRNFSVYHMKRLYGRLNKQSRH